MKHWGDMDAAQKRALIREGGGPTQLLNVLLSVQECRRDHCLDDRDIALVARELSLSEGRVREVISYYTMLNTAPTGRYVLEVCAGAPCHAAGGGWTERMLTGRLGVTMGETTDDGLFTLRPVPCFGACDVSPAVKVGSEVYGGLTPEKLNALIDRLTQEGRAEND